MTRAQQGLQQWQVCPPQSKLSKGAWPPSKSSVKESFVWHERSAFRRLWQLHQAWQVLGRLSSPGHNIGCCSYYVTLCSCKHKPLAVSCSNTTGHAQSMGSLCTIAMSRPTTELFLHNSYSIALQGLAAISLVVWLHYRACDMITCWQEGSHNSAD